LKIRLIGTCSKGPLKMCNNEHNSVSFSQFFLSVCERILAWKYKKLKKIQGIRNLLLASLEDIEEMFNLKVR